MCISKEINGFNKDMDSSNPNPFSTEEAVISSFMAMKAMVGEMYEDRKNAKSIGGKSKENLHNFKKQSKKPHNFKKIATVKKKSLHVLIGRRKDMERQSVGSCIWN